MTNYTNGTYQVHTINNLIPHNMKYIFNVYDGTVYTIRPEQIKNLLEGEVPLLKKPNTSCKKCYGRGYTGKNIERNTYEICPKCVDDNMDKSIMEELRYVALQKNTKR